MSKPSYSVRVNYAGDYDDVLRLYTLDGLTDYQQAVSMVRDMGKNEWRGCLVSVDKLQRDKRCYFQACYQ